MYFPNSHLLYANANGLAIVGGLILLVNMGPGMYMISTKSHDICIDHVTTLRRSFRR